MKKILFLFLISCQSSTDYGYKHNDAPINFNIQESNLSEPIIIKDMKLGESGWADTWTMDENSMVFPEHVPLMDAFITKIRDDAFLKETHDSACQNLWDEGYACVEIKEFEKKIK